MNLKILDYIIICIMGFLAGVNGFLFCIDYILIFFQYE